MRRYRFDEKFTKYLIEKYKFNVTMAAEDIGCHPETIRRACRTHGIKLPRGRKGHKEEVRQRWSKFAKWLKANPDITLGKSIRDIAEQSGCTYKTVAMYFYHRKGEAKNVLDERPWAGADPSITLEATDGSRVPVGSFARIKGYIERPTGQIKLVVQTFSGQTFTFRYSPSKLKKLFVQ